MLFGFSQSVEVEGLFKSGTPPVLTTDRFFNGLLQQHHFGPREIDFTGSEALGRPFRLPR